ncbi:hypothetical protein [Vannielia sp.]|uniref:hypothetical protein n=1 Tax=Vannielia sp. TaxID=2813045 RepID=UPI00260C45E9|nr:hypothetical protein [Vannielia sp.]MDF1873232.1 hypothetical protein [Vannielia sp.]
MIENQSFQSLLQLAVALNVGFAALATFYGNSMTREKSKVEALFESAKVVRDLAMEQDKYDARDRAGFKAVADLRNEVTKRELGLDMLIFDWTRWAAVFCAVGSFLLLVWASMYATDAVSATVWLGSILVNAPFILFVAYAAIRSVIAVQPIRKKRAELDTAMSKKLSTVA